MQGLPSKIAWSTVPPLKEEKKNQQKKTNPCRKKYKQAKQKQKKTEILHVSKLKSCVYSNWRFVIKNAH